MARQSKSVKTLKNIAAKKKTPETWKTFFNARDSYKKYRADKLKKNGRKQISTTTPQA